MVVMLGSSFSKSGFGLMQLIFRRGKRSATWRQTMAVRRVSPGAPKPSRMVSHMPGRSKCKCLSIRRLRCQRIFAPRPSSLFRSLEMSAMDGVEQGLAAAGGVGPGPAVQACFQVFGSQLKALITREMCGHCRLEGFGVA